MPSPYETFKAGILGDPFDPNKKPSREEAVKGFLELQNQLEASLTTSGIVHSSWNNLLAQDGEYSSQGGEVLDSDTGTHLQATSTGYNGASVPNGGRYAWSTSWLRWVRIGDTGYTSKADYDYVDDADALLQTNIDTVDASLEDNFIATFNQTVDLAKVLSGISPNYADVSLLLEGYIDDNGDFLSNVNYEATGFIRVDPNQYIELRTINSLDFTSGTHNLTFYDEKKVKIGEYNVTSLYEIIKISDEISGCHFIRATNNCGPGNFPTGFLLRTYLPDQMPNFFETMHLYPTFYDATNEAYYINENYNMTGLIPVVINQIFHIRSGGYGTRYPLVIGLDTNGKYIESIYAKNSSGSSTVDDFITIANPLVKHVRAVYTSNQVNPIFRGLKVGEIDHPKVICPLNIWGMTTEETPAFARSILPNRNFTVDWAPETATERSFIVDNSEGNLQQHYIEARIANGNLPLPIGFVKFPFHTFTNPTEALNIIALGDSTTLGTGSNVGGSYKDWVNEMSWQMTGVGDRALAGNTYFTSASLSNVFVRGTEGDNAVKHEGRGGWSAEDYLTIASKGSVFNAFWNPVSEAFDFDYYLTNNGFDVGSVATGVNASGSNCLVIIQLGWNDIQAKGAEASATDLGILIDAIKATRTNTKFLVLGLPPTPILDLIRRQNMPVGGRIINPESIFEEWIYPHYEHWRKVALSKTNTSWLDLGPSFDADTGYTKDVNFWNITPWDDVNKYTANRDYVHPNENGNVMIARTIKSWIAGNIL